MRRSAVPLVVQMSLEIKQESTLPQTGTGIHFAINGG
jgi:hypothetical protein